MLLRLLLVLVATVCACRTAEAASAAVDLAPAPAVAGPQDAPGHDYGSRGADRRLGALLERYVWIVPSGIGHRVSLGGGLLLLLALALQLSAKMVDLEDRSFGRCVAFAAVLFAALVAELSLASPEPLCIAILAVVNTAGFWLLATVLLRAKGLAGLAMLACFALAVLVGVVALEIAGFVLSGHLMA